MRIIHLPRQAGKTRSLIKLADHHNGYIVCRDSKEAHRIYNVARKMEEVGEINGINMPITYEDFLHRRYSGRGCKILYIDNAETLLQSMAMCEIGAITVNSHL